MTIDTVKAYFAQTNGKKINLDNKKIVLPISVGQPYHENESFGTTIDLLNQHKLKQCDIIVADTLQRHTIRLHEKCLSDQEAYEKSILLGELWLKRNKKYIEQLTCSHNIFHWNNWLLSEEYTNRRSFIETLIDKNENFRQIFTETATVFVNRYQKKTGENENLNFVFEACLNYVKEECSVMSLWLSREYDYEVYPGKRIKAMILTHEHFIKSKAPDFLQWLRIQFKNLVEFPVTN